AQVVKDLREKTGAGMMECKKALVEANGNVEEAIDILRKKGAMTAAKKAGRVAADGLIDTYLSPDAQRGVLLELNCETDFVAKTDQFKSLLKQLVIAVATKNYTTVADVPTEPITQTIAAMGENIALSRFEKYQVQNNLGLVARYIHPGSKLGVIIELKTQTAAGANNPAVKTLAHELAMQIAAASPDYISRNEVSKEVLDKELEIYKEQAKQEGKPEKILDKIAQGKLGKFYTLVCLLEQLYIRDPNITVAKVIEQTAKEVGEPIAVARFARYKIGEAK
ncbi:MAG: translation elongation factor Ts, partial [bacterium]|nr:translation elongation factor Ts [bacterium]